MISTRQFIVVLVLILPLTGDVIGQSSSDQAASLFENRIRPVLVARCIKCHGPSKSESGLRLDMLQSIITGGDSGPALVPGDVEGSLLSSVVDYRHDIKMPPDNPLNESEVQDFQRWIADGAYWPEQLKLGNGPELRSGPPTDAERAFWSFQPLNDCQPPPVDDSSRVNNDIDRFVQARLRQQSMSSSPPADKRTLIRRLTFDLTGLPPTPEAVEQFVNDESSNALDKLVDRLLSSPAYGERWGRHWLDVVRYSDTAGETADYPVPDAWRYRNYVIDAFNKDKPYDQFLREQIAGDILANQRSNPESYAEQITATGFIAIARRFGFDSENYHHLTIQDAIDTVGQATLGLSIGCARCHDHKFDPLSMEDYYALYGIFESTLFPLAGSEQKQKVRSLVPLRAELIQPAVAAIANRSVAAKQQALQKLGRPVPSIVLRSLTDLDSDFELQSPASGGSRGIMVAPWLYDGPTAVTNAAQSPFINEFPKGKVGVVFPAGQAMAGIWQALNHRSINLSLQSMNFAIDFRVGASDFQVDETAKSSSNQVADVAADLAGTAKSICSTQHHGLRIDLQQKESKRAVGLLIGSELIELNIGQQALELGTVQPNKWYHIEFSICTSKQLLTGQLIEHGGSSHKFEGTLSELPDMQLEMLRVQTSRQTASDLPSFEIDNLSIIPGDDPLQDSDSSDSELSKLSELGNSINLDAELRMSMGVDGDLELQNDQQSPAKPWNSGPNSIVKISTGSQSPFRNYYDAGNLGMHMPNRQQYDGFGQQLDPVQPDTAGHVLASFDFRCASQDAGGSGSWRYYLGHGPGNSAAVELFFNSTQFFRRSADANEQVAGITIGTWYQVQLDLDVNARSYSGKLLSTNSEVDFTGQLASGWDGTIDYTFIDSYGNIGGVRASLDADNFSLGRVSSPVVAANEPNNLAGSAQDLLIRREKVKELRAKLAAVQAAGDQLETQLLHPQEELGYAVVEGTPHDVPIQLGGEPSKPGEVVARRMPLLFGTPASLASVSSSTLSGSGRLDLANWIARDAKDLAARVMVNRVWQQHFGRGLVRTENDFGTRGELPTHPELLDWLASRFIESGWSIKQLHRLIITSATYQQSSRPNEQYSKVDPENRWLWRFSPRPLSAEEIRDSMLLVSGMLDTSMGQAHPFPAPHTWGFSQHSPFYAVYESNRRSVYLMQQRIKRHPFLALFDGADPNVSTARRDSTIVPTQALYLLNNPFVHEVANSMAERCMTATSSSQAINSLCQQCLGREAGEDEINRATLFLDQYASAQMSTESLSDKPGFMAWAALARTFVTRNEFLFVE